MYKEEMTCCEKADGKILREKEEERFIPFGNEVSLYFKNSADLERFITNNGGDMNSDICFKFIQKTQKINDDLIRVKIEIM